MESEEEVVHDLDEEYDTITPKPTVKKTGASKPQAKVTFEDEDIVEEDSDTPYRASQDGSPQYSGSDDDVPLEFSPRRLRKKPRAAAKKVRGKKGALDIYFFLHSSLFLIHLPI